MFVYKKLKPSDVSITPFEAHKQFSYDSSSAGDNGITFRTTLWTSESKYHYSANNIAGNFYHHRDYFQFDKGFYRDYILNHSNLIPETNYIKQERRKYDKINILSIPQNLFGSEIQPTTFRVTGSFEDKTGIVTQIEIKDDGEGNLYPTSYTLGSNNWPSEKNRLVYIGPTDGYLRKDLTVDNTNGFKLVNSKINSLTFFNSKLNDDSYFLNEVNYNNAQFTGNSPLTFISFTEKPGYLTLPHNEIYNFSPKDDFAISFYFKITTQDQTNITGTADKEEFYFLAKADKKTITPISGNLPVEVDSNGGYPFKLYYKNTALNTGSIIFERSNGQKAVSLVKDLFLTSDNVGDLIHVCAQKSGSTLEIFKNGVSLGTTSDIVDSITCKDLSTKNKANLYIGSKGGNDKYLRSNLSQIMIWDKYLTPTQIQNISESITGTPYIGNVFYPEGFATITHPSYTDYLFNKYSGSLTQNLTLEPTYGNENVHDFSLEEFNINLSETKGFSSHSFTFFNEKILFDKINPNQYTLLGETTQVSTQTDPSSTTYKPYTTFEPKFESILRERIILNPINEEITRLDFMTASNFDTASTSAQPFLPADGFNSITAVSASINSGLPQYAFLSSSAVVDTPEFQILFASNSKVITTEDFDEAYSVIEDSIFTSSLDYSEAYQSTGSGLVNHTVPLHQLLISSSIPNKSYFKGMLVGLSGPAAQNVTTEFATTVDFNSDVKYDDGWPLTSFTTTNYVTPNELTDGINFDHANNRIEFLETPKSDIKLQFVAQVKNIVFGGTACKLKLQLEKNNTILAGDIFPTPNGGFYSDAAGDDITDDAPSITINTSHTLDASSISPGDFFTLKIIITDSGPGAFDQTVSYTIFNRAFKALYDTDDVTYEANQEGYSNLLTIAHVNTGSGDNGIKTNAIYSYKLEGIVSRPTEEGVTAPYTNGNVSGNKVKGLNKNIDGDDMGVRVTLKRGNTVITSSFYDSGSGNTERDFNFDYFTGDNTENVNLFIYPGIASTENPQFTAASQSFYIGQVGTSTVGDFTINEKSGSNILRLDVNLGGNFNVSSNDPTLNLNSLDQGLLSTSPLTSTIESVSSADITLPSSDIYFITSAISASAIASSKQFVSAALELSASADGIYRVENFLLGTGSANFTNNDGLLSFHLAQNNSLTNAGNFLSVLSSGVPRIRFFKANTLISEITGSRTSVGSEIITAQGLIANNPSLHDGTSGRLKIENLDIGHFASESILKVILDIVEPNDTSTPITSSTGEGFSINDFRITALTSSATMSVSNESSEQFTSEITHIYFDSPHSSQGDTNFPLFTGSIATASVTYVNDNTVILDSTPIFTTSSTASPLFASALASSSTAPLEIIWSDEVKAGSLIGFNAPTITDDWVKTFYSESGVYLGGDINDNEGLQWFLLDEDNNILISSSFINSASADHDSGTPQATRYHTVGAGSSATQTTSSKDQSIFLSIKSVDSHSNHIPVSWSIQLKNAFLGSNFDKDSGHPYFFEHSGSFISSLITGSVFTDQSSDPDLLNIFKISSSHPNTNVNSLVKKPFTLGTVISKGSLVGVGSIPYQHYQVDLSAHLDDPLFIRNRHGNLNPLTHSISGSQIVTNYYNFNSTQSINGELPKPILEGNFEYEDNIYNITSILNTSSFTVDTPFAVTSNDDANIILNYHTTSSQDYNVEFKNTHLIFEHEYQCSVDEDEYNFTRNITARKFKTDNSSELDDCTTASLDNSQIRLFKPYVTTVGLYDDDYNLLAVGKFAQPIKMSEETDMTFVIRYDT